MDWRPWINISMYIHMHARENVVSMMRNTWTLKRSLTVRFSRARSRRNNILWIYSSVPFLESFSSTLRRPLRGARRSWRSGPAACSYEEVDTLCCIPCFAKVCAGDSAPLQGSKFVLLFPRIRNTTIKFETPHPPCMAVKVNLGEGGSTGVAKGAHCRRETILSGCI